MQAVSKGPCRQPRLEVRATIGILQSFLTTQKSRSRCTLIPRPCTALDLSCTKGCFLHGNLYMQLWLLMHLVSWQDKYINNVHTNYKCRLRKAGMCTNAGLRVQGVKGSQGAHSWVSSACSGDISRSSGSSVVSGLSTGTTLVMLRFSAYSCATHQATRYMKGYDRHLLQETQGLAQNFGDQDGLTQQAKHLRPVNPQII